MKILAILFVALLGFAHDADKIVAQASFPDPPNDLTRIYFLKDDHELLPLPFESGIVSVNVFQPAIEDKITRVRVAGPSAATVLTG
ncbi:MAG TPA: hypothetical protein VF751_06045, partial [Chthoniobacterales bacterium]